MNYEITGPCVYNHTLYLRRRTVLENRRVMLSSKKKVLLKHESVLIVIRSARNFHPQGVLASFLYGGGGGPCQYLGSEILQQNHIWGL